MNPDQAITALLSMADAAALYDCDADPELSMADAIRWHHANLHAALDVLVRYVGPMGWGPDDTTLDLSQLL